MSESKSDMSSPQNREEALFQAAVQLTGAERTAFLNGACLGDDTLRQRLDALLAAHDAPDELSPKGAPAAVATMKLDLADKPDEAIGQKIGRYKLLERVGEGGCGVVYVAEQTEPVRRRVALKVIKLGMDTKQVVARFEAERQALAMMDHPNIAKVLDAGTTDVGRPFFVMELVRGIRITDYCDQANLSTNDRLDLFIKVCQAIQHAHQKGIIHRDIKPSNILVTLHDGVPVPKVIDFGIAKATEGRLTDATVYTQLHQFIGTPAYMSPEQAEMSGLDIDTRSDIYSLGVLLYELLTGKTPFDGQELMSLGIDAMRKTIREKEPARPSTRLAKLQGDELTTTAKRRSVETSKLANLLRGDLDWIVMKCLEKDRARRYETANGLAADLNRHLNDEPVVARPPSTAYKFQKAFRRNKLAFTAGGAIAAALVLGIAASLWQAVRAQQESARAKSAEQRAVAALDELRAAAPAFADQARSLAATERFDDAIEKLDYALKLRPDVADYFVTKGDLLECQFKLTEAASAYNAALQLNPGLARAQASAQLCDNLLAAKPNDHGTLSRESLAKLYLAMQQQQRSAAELMPVARLLGEEKKIVVAYWLARLKNLPVTADKPLEQRLLVSEDGLLALDLSDTKVADLLPLTGMPLGSLNLNGCNLITDFSALRGFRSLSALGLNGTALGDLAPLSGLPLQELSFNNTRISDLSGLRGMKLKKINLSGTRVADLSPLAGMPLHHFEADSIPATDYSPLAGAPLEECIIQNSPLTDLSFLKGSPVQRLILSGCEEARGFVVLDEMKSLNLLVLPQNFRALPDADFNAIGALRTNAALKNIEAGNVDTSWQIGATQPRNVFWRDWDSGQTFLPALRKSGFKFLLYANPDGTFFLEIKNEPLSDLSILKGAPISRLEIIDCNVTDLTVLRDLPLDYLNLWGNPVTDLSPLSGTRLRSLDLVQTKISDLSPLAGLPLQTLYLEGCAQITDVSILLKIPTLQKLTVPAGAQNIELLRQLPNLRMLAYVRIYTGEYNPNLTAKEFWKEFTANKWQTRLRDSGFKIKALQQLPDGTWDLDLEGQPISDLRILGGMPISSLHLGETAIFDLAPLRGMALKQLYLYNTKVTDLSPLKGMPLEVLNLSGTEVSDLSVLRGMPLISLRLSACPRLTDLSPLAGDTTLQQTTLPEHAKNFDFLRDFPKLARLSYTENTSSWQPDKKATEFWQAYDARKKMESKQP